MPALVGNRRLLLSRGASAVGPIFGSIAYDFVNGVYEWQDTEYASFAALVSAGKAAFTRADEQHYHDLSVSATADLPLIGSSGLLYEPSHTNLVRNGQGTGGTDGTNQFPTNWAVQGTLSGITRTLVGRGTEGGFAYVDMRWAGTASGTQTKVGVNFETTTGIAAVQNDQVVGSVYARLVAGAITGFNNIRMGVTERNSGGTFLTDAMGSSVTINGTDKTRLFVARTMAQATAAFAQTSFNFDYTNGSVMDATFRFYLPQLEKGVTTPKSPVLTTGSARSVAACALTIELPAGVHNLLVSFDDNSTQEIDGVSGSYALPTNLNRALIKSIVGEKVA